MRRSGFVLASALSLGATRASAQESRAETRSETRAESRADARSETRDLRPETREREILIGETRIVPAAEVRIRGELRHDAPELGGLSTLGVDSGKVRDAWAVFSRARLGALFERGPVGVKVTLQDARSWGTSVPGMVSGGAGGFASTGAYEAYAELHGDTARPRFVRAGRQAIHWGDGSLVGAGDALPTGRSLDAVRAVYATRDLMIDAFATILETSVPLGPSIADRVGPTKSGAQLYALRVEYTLAPALTIEAMGFARLASASGFSLDGSRFMTARSDSETYTAALALSGDVFKFRYSATGAYQGGTTQALAGAKIEAWAAKASVERRIDDLFLAPLFHIGASYASGDDGSGSYKQFDPVLPDPWTHYGAMDAFAWSNVMEGHGRVVVTPATDFDVFAEYRYATLADERGEWINGFLSTVARPGGPPAPLGGAVTSGASRSLGHQIDAGVSVRPWAPVSFRAGYSMLLFGDGAKLMLSSHRRGEVEPTGFVRAHDAAHMGYVVATVALP